MSTRIVQPKRTDEPLTDAERARLARDVKRWREAREQRVIATAERIYVTILAGELPPEGSERLAKKCLDQAEEFHRAIERRPRRRN